MQVIYDLNVVQALAPSKPDGFRALPGVNRFNDDVVPCPMPAGMPALQVSVQATPHWECGRPRPPMGVAFQQRISQRSGERRGAGSSVVC